METRGEVHGLWCPRGEEPRCVTVLKRGVVERRIRVIEFLLHFPRNFQPLRGGICPG